MLETGLELLANFPEYTLVVCTSLEATDKGLEKGCLPEGEKIHNTQFFLQPSEHHPRCSDTEVQSFGVSC